MMICSRRLYKGNAYDICLPLADSGVTLARFYTRGDVILEKEPEISGDSMCFSFTEEDLASLEDGVLRYQVVTDYETTDTNSPYVVATPGDYSGSTLEDLLEDAYNSGYTAGYESGYTDGQEECGPDYSKEYFTIEILEDGDFTVNRAIKYSINDGEWIQIMSPAVLHVNSGDKIRFKGEEWVFTDQMFSGNTIQFNVYGNIMSLNYGDDYEDKTRFLHRCDWMFYHSTGLVDASNLILPAMELTDNFSCSAMFSGCTSLTTAPELPATALTRICYSNMFADCINLLDAPELPATTLLDMCYSYMFKNCANINYVKCLATDISADSCLQNWVDGVSTTGTFVKAAGVSWPTGSSGIPAGWTVIETE